MKGADPTVAVMHNPAALLTLQFLAWIAERPRTYAETMEAWRTSCPRLSVWEDANLDGLVRLEGGEERQTLVRLTAAGRAALERQALTAR
jgi:hypothetical protein